LRSRAEHAAEGGVSLVCGDELSNSARVASCVLRQRADEDKTRQNTRRAHSASANNIVSCWRREQITSMARVLLERAAWQGENDGLKSSTRRDTLHAGKQSETSLALYLLRIFSLWKEAWRTRRGACWRRASPLGAPRQFAYLIACAARHLLTTLLLASMAICAI